MTISITQTNIGLWVRLRGEPGQFELALTALKREIPRQGRRFDTVQRCWIIDRDYQAQIDHWLARMQCETRAEVVYKNKRQDRRPTPAPGHQLGNAYATLHLLPTAPPELVKAAYRCLAMMNHPDRGGDTQDMQRINGAYARLSTRGT